MSQSDIAISIRGLSKAYSIAHQGNQRPTFRDVLMDRLRHPFRTISKETFWALKDVSLDVHKGDVVGIIGRNGAGKSTLLKILSRITKPTAGEVDVYGRVGSLLEVGTGFHPELTGRENIYLNGAILGMRRAEIRKQFDAIVDFADVEKFLDTPVKRYSSGMYVRLAFAVAAHLSPEILIVDEVLSVGDTLFQKKCLGKMDEVAKGGRTVMFVSHNMGAVEQLCQRGVLMSHGSVEYDDYNVQGAIQKYLITDSNSPLRTAWVNSGNEYENPWFKPISFQLLNSSGRVLDGAVTNSSEVWLVCEGEVQTRDPILIVGYAVYSEDGRTVYVSYYTDQAEDRWPIVRLGRMAFRTKIPARFLNEGIYRLDLIGGLHGRQWLFAPGKSSVTTFLQIQGGLSDSPYWNFKRPGDVAPVIEWTTE